MAVSGRCASTGTTSRLGQQNSLSSLLTTNCWRSSRPACSKYAGAISIPTDRSCGVCVIGTTATRKRSLPSAAQKRIRQGRALPAVVWRLASSCGHRNWKLTTNPTAGFGRVTVRWRDQPAPFLCVWARQSPLSLPRVVVAVQSADQALRSQVRGRRGATASGRRRPCSAPAISRCDVAMMGAFGRGQAGHGRSLLIIDIAHYAPGVVQVGPGGGIYWRTSSQFAHWCDGSSLAGYWVPQAVQMNACLAWRSVTPWAQRGRAVSHGRGDPCQTARPMFPVEPTQGAFCVQGPAPRIPPWPISPIPI